MAKRLLLIVLGIMTSMGLFFFERSPAENRLSVNNDNNSVSGASTGTPLLHLQNDSEETPAAARPLEQGGLVFILRIQLLDDKQEIKTHSARMNSSVGTIKYKLKQQLGAPEPLCKVLEGNLLLLEFPGLYDIDVIEQALGTTQSILDFHIVYPQKKLGTNGDLPDAALELPLQARSGETLVVYKEPTRVAGQHGVDANAVYDKYYPAVHIELDAEGAALLGKVTAANIGQSMAIVVDSSVISAPTIHDKIGGGKIAIYGNLSYAEVSNLALALRASSLVQPFTILEKRVIAPAVGKGVGS